MKQQLVRFYFEKQPVKASNYISENEVITNIFSVVA